MFKGAFVNYDSQFLTADDSISDDVFEMDDDRSSVTNVVSGGLTPATVERTLEKTPSPTGYRDYKPPAEVLSNNYSTTFKTTSDFDSVRSALKRDQQRDDNFAHKVRRLLSAGILKEGSLQDALFILIRKELLSSTNILRSERPSFLYGKVSPLSRYNHILS